MDLQTTAPAGVFKGHNFMTPHILGYFRGKVGPRVAWIELAEGEGVELGTTLYGVSFRRADGGELWREHPNGSGGFDPGKCFRSKAAALEYIARFLRPMECPSCGQWTRSRIDAVPDCLNDCYARGLA